MNKQEIELHVTKPLPLLQHCNRCDADIMASLVFSFEFMNMVNE